MSRREFVERTALAAGVMALEQAPAAGAAKPSAVDLVPLGKTGKKICRLGMGTGSNGGQVQRDLGHNGFNRLIRHGWDRGIRFIDTADAYQTHAFVREAIKGLPREQLWIQTKMKWDDPTPPERPLEVLDRFRRELDTDYVDSLLIHCVTKPTWPDDLKRMMDAFSEAKARGWIRLKGVSCHGLPSLIRANSVEWIDVQLARVNPQGHVIDGADGAWKEPGIPEKALPAIREARETGRGMIAMKLIGNGDFTRPEDRERAMRYAMTCGYVDSVVVGFASAAEIDETIDRMNRALRAG